MTKLYTNPFYDQEIDDWIRFRDFVEGDQEKMRSQYVVPFDHETKTLDGDKKMSGRLRRTFYTNYTRRIILAWLAFLFKNSPDFTNIERLIPTDQQKNVDGQRKSFENWIKFDLVFKYLQYGSVFALVDAPQQGARVRPLVTAISPIDVPHWQLQDGGFKEGAETNRFEWIDWQYVRLERAADSSVAPSQRLVRKRFLMRGGRVEAETWVVQNKEKQTFDPSNINYRLAYDWIQEGEPVVLDARFKEIPITQAGQGSFIKDVVPESEREFNLGSSEDNIYHHTGYQKHVAIGEFVSDSPKIWSETTILQMKEGAGTSFITVPAGNAEGIRKRRIEVRDNIFTLGLNQFDKLPSDSRAAQSDKTKRQELENTVALARSITSELEDLINNVVSDWALFRGLEPRDNEKVTLSTDFDTDDLEQLMGIYTATRDDMEKLPETLKEVLKKVFSFYEFDAGKRKQIEAEIDAANFGSAGTVDVRNRLLQGISNNGGQVQEPDSAGSGANGS